MISDCPVQWCCPRLPPPLLIHRWITVRSKSSYSWLIPAARQFRCCRGERCLRRLKSDLNRIRWYGSRRTCGDSNRHIAQQIVGDCALASADWHVESDVSANGVPKALGVIDSWGQAMAPWGEGYPSFELGSLTWWPTEIWSTNISQTREKSQRRDWLNAQKCFTHASWDSYGIDKSNGWYFLVCWTIRFCHLNDFAQSRFG